MCRLLAVVLLHVALIMFEPPAWGMYRPSVILMLMATVYIVSRFQYIPVPHLEFHKLISGSERLPPAVQLGLTLPACTPPLFIIVLATTITLDSTVHAVVAAMTFTSLFTLPTAVTSMTGMMQYAERQHGYACITVSVGR